MKNENKIGYDYAMLNVYYRIMSHVSTTNNSEKAYKKSLGDELVNSHPSLLLFIRKLKIKDLTYSKEIKEILFHLFFFSMIFTFEVILLLRRFTMLKMKKK
ncbi:hypothetical protein DMUE_2183 [Dictyocoela muelleri]|nr:hypothetical protein DMUE_2183 [Dictyocoela muelleri]